MRSLACGLLPVRQRPSSRAVFGPFPGEGYLEALAVAGHHRFLADRDLFDETRFANSIEWEPDEQYSHLGSQGSDQGDVPAAGMEDPLRQGKTGRRAATQERGPTTGTFPTSIFSKSRRGCRRRWAVIAGSRQPFVSCSCCSRDCSWPRTGWPAAPRVRTRSWTSIRSVVRIGPGRLTEHLRERVEARRLKDPSVPAFCGLKDFQNEVFPGGGARSGHRANGKRKDRSGAGLGLDASRAGLCAKNPVPVANHGHGQ